MVDNKLCQRCGQCCNGLVWRKKRSYKNFPGLGDRSNAEKEIIQTYRQYLDRIGIPVTKILPIEWDEKNKEVMIKAQAGTCRNLSFLPDGKALCLNYAERPNECRNFICKKAEGLLAK
ncbi:MAG TPA: hypothetical protein VFF28_00055 [Candidatus Nanoarchaeia archaeon]|nr:hypothetical protein [Candidatus Nanoarchaeia archaeon]